MRASTWANYDVLIGNKIITIVNEMYFVFFTFTEPCQNRERVVCSVVLVSQTDSTGGVVVTLTNIEQKIMNGKVNATWPYLLS